jgi:hypothetical protein
LEQQEEYMIQMGWGTVEKGKTYLAFINPPKQGETIVCSSKLWIEMIDYENKLYLKGVFGPVFWPVDCIVLGHFKTLVPWKDVREWLATNYCYKEGFSEVRMNPGIENESSIDENSVIRFAEHLRKIQPDGENTLDNGIIFIADNDKNYYIQFMAGCDDTPLGRHEDSLYAEAVGNEVLEPEHQIKGNQIGQLEKLGWKRPYHSPNFYQTWRASTDEDRRAIARIVIRTFKVYGVSKESLVDCEIQIV